MSRIQWAKLSKSVQHFIFIFKNLLDTVEFESEFQSFRTSGMCQVFGWFIRSKTVGRLGIQTFQTLQHKAHLELPRLRFLFFWSILISSEIK